MLTALLRYCSSGSTITMFSEILPSIITTTTYFCRAVAVGVMLSGAHYWQFCTQGENKHPTCNSVLMHFNLISGLIFRLLIQEWVLKMGNCSPLEKYSFFSSWHVWLQQSGSVWSAGHAAHSVPKPPHLVKTA